ncbi:hypothetical protein ACFUGD_00040 [Streptomyces sp. NPDC057217]
MVSGAVTAGAEKLSRPERVVAPASAATCTATSNTKGCRSVEFV